MEGVVPAPRRRTTGGSSRPRKVIKPEKGAGKKRGSDNVKTETPSEAPSASRVKDEPTEMETIPHPSTDQVGGSSGGMNHQAPSSPELSPGAVPPMFTMPAQVTTPGPSRRDFGPFAGAYPPPGVVLESQQDQPPVTAVKQEPRWEG